MGKMDGLNINSNFIDQFKNHEFCLKFGDGLFEGIGKWKNKVSENGNNLEKVKQIDDLEIKGLFQFHVAGAFSNYYNGEVTIKFKNKPLIKITSSEPIYSIRKSEDITSPSLFSTIKHKGSFSYSMTVDFELLEKIKEDRIDLLNYIRMFVKYE